MVIIGILGFIMITFSKQGSTLPVELETCLQPWMSSLYSNCSSQEYFKIHCVLDDNYQPVIDCLKNIKIGAGLCPFYSKRFKALDAHDCVGDKSMCPQNIYLSHEVYKYPGCLNKTLYVTEPPPTTSVTETSDELSDNVTDTCVGKCSNGSVTTLLIAFLMLFVVLSSCLLFFILFFRRKILKDKASDRCHISRRNGKTGKRTESSSPVELQIEPLNGTCLSGTRNLENHLL